VTAFILFLFLALAFLIWALAKDWKRAVKFWSVVVRQEITDTERRAVVWVARFVWVYLLCYVAMIGR
jgi:hypothetical protein